MPAIFSDGYLQGLIREAEEVISTEVKCIFNRFPLDITAGTSTYQLPEGVTGIIQVAWKGTILDPLETQDFNYDGWFKPQNLGVRNKPQYYLRVGNGYNRIQFYPIPDETIVADDSELDNDVGISSQVIISAWRVADVFSTDRRLPEYLFRNLMKYYAMARAYAREGKGQNLIASDYFKKKYLFYLQAYKETMEKVPQAVQVRFGSDVRGGFKPPPRPVFPTSGKWSF